MSVLNPTTIIFIFQRCTQDFCVKPSGGATEKRKRILSDKYKTDRSQTPVNLRKSLLGIFDNGHEDFFLLHWWCRNTNSRTLAVLYCATTSCILGRITAVYILYLYRGNESADETRRTYSFHANNRTNHTTHVYLLSSILCMYAGRVRIRTSALVIIRDQCSEFIQ